MELGCVQLPGRDTNRLEPFTDFNSLIRALVSVAGDACTLPLAFFGHSMGTLISFELAREFRTRNWPAPVQMFLSGHRAPPPERFRDAAARITGRTFRPGITTTVWGNPRFLQSPELAELFLPLLRADFSVCETYRYRPDEPLDSPFFVLGGGQDRKVH